MLVACFVDHMNPPFESSDCDCERIFLVQTTANPLYIVLNSALSTEALNFITWSHAYALLPYPIFILHRSYILEWASNQARGQFAGLLKSARLIPGSEVEPIDIKDVLLRNCAKLRLKPSRWSQIRCREFQG